MAALTFGNVHGVYKPGNVKLRPEILKEIQEAVGAKYGKEKPLDLVFHGGSGSLLEEIREALDYGVVKMNIDTDTQYAFTRPVADHMLRNYDGVLKIDGEVGNKKAVRPARLGQAGRGRSRHPGRRGVRAPALHRHPAEVTVRTLSTAGSPSGAGRRRRPGHGGGRDASGGREHRDGLVETSSVRWMLADRSPAGDRGEQRAQQRLDRQRRSSTPGPGRRTRRSGRPCRRTSSSPPGTPPARCRPSRARRRCRPGPAAGWCPPGSRSRSTWRSDRRTGSPARARTARWGWPARRSGPSQAEPPLRGRWRVTVAGPPARRPCTGRGRGSRGPPPAGRSPPSNSPRRPGRQERAQVGRLHHARAAAGDDQPAGPRQLASPASPPSGTARAARHRVPAHDPDHRLRPVRGGQAAGRLGQGVVDAVRRAAAGRAPPARRAGAPPCARKWS